MPATIGFGEYRPDVSDYNGQHTQVLANVLARGDGYGPVKALQAFAQPLASGNDSFTKVLLTATEQMPRQPLPTAIPAGQPIHGQRLVTRKSIPPTPSSVARRFYWTARAIGFRRRIARILSSVLRLP